MHAIMRDKDSSSAGDCNAISPFRVFSSLVEGMNLEGSPIALKSKMAKNVCLDSLDIEGKTGEKVIKMVYRRHVCRGENTKIP